MTIQAFTGGAGCGKTYSLMQSLNTHLDAAPLADGQKVLALTYMHGSRRRLEERLGTMKVLRGRADCATVDSFALKLLRRWQALATRLGHAPIEANQNQYERVCDVAADLLQVKEVRGWVAAAFPVLLVDEAQDLTANRLRIIQGLATRLKVFAAADEFQCLDEALRPNPACAWLDEACSAQELRQPKRTNVAELLDAATAIRAGRPPDSGKLFKVQLASKPQLAGAWISGNLLFYGGGKSVAIITPTLGKFARDALTWVAGNKTKSGAGPYALSWEESEAKAAQAFVAGLPLNESNEIGAVTALLAAAGDARVARDVTEWMERQRRARAKATFCRQEVVRAIEKAFEQRRRAHKGEGRGWRGTTVHGAKNREFDNVIVLWPAAVAGNDEQKRRLLYNAVTRAKKRCLVLVQAKAQLQQAPFA